MSFKRIYFTVLAFLMYNTDHIVSLYESGLSGPEIADRIDCNLKTVYRHLDRAGVERTGNRTRLPVEEIISKYRDGASLLSLSNEYDIARHAIKLRLRENGVEIRGASEANKLRMQDLSPEERSKLTDAANRARRELSDQQERELARKQAKTKERTKSKVGQRERRFAQWLRECGYEPTLQKAVDVYNIDICVGTVAIEVHVHSSHPHGHPYYTRRIEDLLERGFDVLYIKMRVAEKPLTSRACDEACAFIDLRQRDKATGAEYRVIRGSGDPIATGRLNGNQLTTETTSEHLLGAYG